MNSLSAQQRKSHIQSLTQNEIDVLVIGGGITGAGIALDAATRGYRVGLVEKNDFASGTSSWSTKLVHGGIRYLPQGDVPLVHEALVERGRLLTNAPHLVHPLAFVLPLYTSSRRPVGLPVAPPNGVGLPQIMDFGLGMYDVLASGGHFQRHKRISIDEVKQRAPMLVSDGLTAGFLYTDGQTDDTRLTIAVLRSAASAGAELVNYATVVGFERDTYGKLAGAHVQLNGPGEEHEQILIHARYCINATGVFAEHVESLTGDTPKLAIEPSKGVHIVLRRSALEIGEDAVVLPETDDHRVIFLVPWRSSIIVGTTDTGNGDLDWPMANNDDVSYLLDHLNRSVQKTIKREDIVSSFAGYRPLLRLRNARSTSRLSRTHMIAESAHGLISISGGKLTTYRQMAEDAVDRIDRHEGVRNPCATRNWPLAGAIDWETTRASLQQRALQAGLSSEIFTHLGISYGALAQDIIAMVEQDSTLARQLDSTLPAIAAEVDYAIQQEMALTVTDVLERRLRLGIEAFDHGLSSAQYVSERLQTLNGITSAQGEQLVREYQRYVQLHTSGLQPEPAANAL